MKSEVLFLHPKNRCADPNSSPGFAFIYTPLSCINPMNGTTPVPGPTMIIGVFFYSGIKKVDSLMKILFENTLLGFCLSCS
mmetsp:Transcript_35842/g.34884  ORF Transcript_35842/g.34884 Transcript_35842/m.34884 type:complete len:81 (-) Transcript_35842:1518-1760(-)